MRRGSAPTGPSGQRRDHRQAGFTVFEMIVALAVMAILIVAVLAVFDFNSRLARVQTNVAEAQQSLRVAQYDMVRMTRMAARGSLASGTLPAGIAVAVRNNADSTENIKDGDNATPKVLEGTDILTVRGVFNTPVYQVSYGVPGTVTYTPPPPAAPTSGCIVIADGFQLPGATGNVIPQDLAPLIEAVDEDRPEALILVSPLDDSIYQVVQLDPSAPCTSTGDPAFVTLGFHVTGGTHSPQYTLLSPGAFPVGMNVAALGLVEEYRFYVKEERAVPTDPASDLVPRLSRARAYPGTDTPHAEDPTWGIDLADHIFDLQVALGVDGNPADGEVIEGAAGARDNDEWLFNDPGDDPADPTWSGANPLYYVRITTLARTERRDPAYQAPAIDPIEDRDYSATPYNTVREERMFRRRMVRTLVDLRNAG